MDGPVTCPLHTQLPRSWCEHSSPGVQLPELRAYKLGKKRWSYNQVELLLGQESCKQTAAVREAVHAGATEFPEAQKDSAVAFQVELESGVELQVHVYLCFDRQADDGQSTVPTGGIDSYGSGGGRPPVTGHQSYTWDLVTRKHCCKGCEGRVLRCIQRLGRLGKRSCRGEPKAEPPQQPSSNSEPPSLSCGQRNRKDPRYMYLSLDEACTHVDAPAFRLVAGIYNRQGTRLLTTAVSPPIRVLANNDVPTGAARIPLEARLPTDWEGWAAEEAAGAGPPVKPKATSRPQGVAAHRRSNSRKGTVKARSPASRSSLPATHPVPIPPQPCRPAAGSSSPSLSPRKSWREALTQSPAAADKQPAIHAKLQPPVQHTQHMQQQQQQQQLQPLGTAVISDPVARQVLPVKGSPCAALPLPSTRAQRCPPPSGARCQLASELIEPALSQHPLPACTGVPPLVQSGDSLPACTGVPPLVQSGDQLPACGTLGNAAEAPSSKLVDVNCSGSINQEPSLEANHCSTKDSSSRTVGTFSSLGRHMPAAAGTAHTFLQPSQQWLVPATGTCSGVAAGFVPSRGTNAQAKAECHLLVVAEVNANLAADSNQAASSGCEIAVFTAQPAWTAAAAPTAAEAAVIVGCVAPGPQHDELVAPVMKGPATAHAHVWAPAAAGANTTAAATVASSGSVVPSEEPLEEYLRLHQHLQPPMLDGLPSGSFASGYEEQEQLHTLMLPPQLEPPEIGLYDYDMVPFLDDVLAGF